MYVYAAPVFLVPVKVRKGCQILWNWNQVFCKSSKWFAEPSLQTILYMFLVSKIYLFYFTYINVLPA